MEELPKTIVCRVVKDKLNECSPDTEHHCQQRLSSRFLRKRPYLYPLPLCHGQ
ncbi:hypothetical protein Patl1_11191 [Pistacia atlantica]|uniref:Uncharacterized protein n=1 Tax=Pistacia atlantica TaxID=434234 RepID=A0ACC1A9Z1_9ROSI|nr:hypothetical protein Patl1_11191 [Pistacia atlantica]